MASQSQPSGSPQTKGLTQEDFNKYYRQNVRQHTRGILGVGLSGAMTPVLPYMALPTGVAVYSVHQADKVRDKLAELEKHGYRTRRRDVLRGITRGAAEKLTLTFLLLGHDDMLLLDKSYGLEELTAAHCEIMHDENGVPTAMGEINSGLQVPVESVQEEFDVPTAGDRVDWFEHGGETVSGWHGFNVAEDVVAAGATAAAVEYAVNRPIQSFERPYAPGQQGTSGASGAKQNNEQNMPGKYLG